VGREDVSTAFAFGYAGASPASPHSKLLEISSIWRRAKVLGSLAGEI